MFLIFRVHKHKELKSTLVQGIAIPLLKDTKVKKLLEKMLADTSVRHGYRIKSPATQSIVFSLQQFLMGINIQPKDLLTDTPSMSCADPRQPPVAGLAAVALLTAHAWSAGALAAFITLFRLRA